MPAHGALVVIDTNVWISGLISLHGAPAQITRHAIRSMQPVFSAATFEELRERLWRPKFDRYVTIEQRRAFLNDLDGIASWVTIAPAIGERTLCRDPADDKFIHTALAAQPCWLVTGDKDLLVLAGDLAGEGVSIASPGDVMLARASPDWAGLLDAVARNKDEDTLIERRQTRARRDPFEGAGQ